ncbi:GNAT family N-acetyltransferase [Lentibacillus sediminis]|uniref:GNAT family N-acetyltransferase n=1 Tax=Lentibacillus sediminis TaxID=1940529 RepID=UPI000C1BB50C|nr:GNAT family protein [Lentibacillus sediminis]
MRRYETERLTVRDIELDDAGLIEKYASDYDLAKTTLNIPHPYPKGSAKEFVTASLQAQEEGKLLILAVTVKPENEFIGLINLNINKVFNRAELGYWIAKPFWGKGFGTEAAKEIVRVGFEELKLNRIYAQAFTTNPGSYRIMEKVGLKHEGILKEHVKRNGDYFDIKVYGMTKSEYNLLKNQARF